MKKIIPIMLIALTLTALFSACSKRVGHTTVRVADSIRHYYAMVTGEELSLNYELENTGEEPLIIEDIQPSCGCIVVDWDTKIIPPGQKLKLHFTYNSIKNVGYVRHIVRVFGNIEPKGVTNLVFDVNVVPDAEYTRDYEELYQEWLARRRSEGIDELVNGNASQQGYYTDDINHDSREQDKYPWRKNGQRK